MTEWSETLAKLHLVDHANENGFPKKPTEILPAIFWTLHTLRRFSLDHFWPLYVELN